MGSIIEIKREVLKDVIKFVIKRIKEIQDTVTYTQEDSYSNQSKEFELIQLKISLEKWRKKLKHEEHGE